MKNIILLATILFGYQTVFAQDYQKAIEKARFLIEHHQKQTQVPGIQVAIMVDDSLIWSQGFGYSDLNAKTLVDKLTKFRIASISKSVTSVALGKMMEQQVVDIDKDIKVYLSEFPKKAYPITSRQLAASTAGIRHYTKDDTDLNTVDYPGVISSLERFQNDALLFEPGTDYQYSSYGWVLLSAVMEKASGKPFMEIMEETWGELGMDHSSFDFPIKEVPLKSTFYVYSKKNSRIEAPLDNRSYMYAGGGYLSTAEDLVSMGNQLIKDEYLTKVTRNTLFSSYKLQNGADTNYGLGWECGISRTNTPVVYHSGNMPSARSHLVIYPERNIVFVYLANTGDNIFFNDREAHSIAELFVNQKESITNAIIGEWEITTTSLRDKKTAGTLILDKNTQGIIEGSITFKRSKKEGTYPVLLAGANENQVHLIAVSPMFLDIYLTIDGDSARGKWLHDFNINGIPETDDYWNPRDISAKKKTFSNKK